MDPNEALENARRALAKIREAEVNANDPFANILLAITVLDSFEALDEWLSKGGFLPDAWSQR